MDNAENALKRISLFHISKHHPLLSKNKNGEQMLLILAGNKGLVGGLWHALVNEFLKNKGRYGLVIVVGEKAGSYLREEGMKIERLFTQSSDTTGKEMSEEISEYIFAKVAGGAVSDVDVLYPKFVSLAEQTPTFMRFLPFVFDAADDISASDDKKDGFPIFEPSEQKIFDALLRKYISLFLYKAIMETRLSELSARTVSMEHASVKTKELIGKLTLGYLKERRRFITQKQLESFTVHSAV
jgi:F-type H+-transporting ATPase subunit gamma